MLVCDNLSVSFGDKEILKNVSFSLAKSQNLLILGENGAGKSTLAKALCSLTPSNSISLFERELSHIPPKERAALINYVPPKLESYDEDITLMEYLQMGYFSRKKKFEPTLPCETEAALGLLCGFGLEDLAHKRLQTLSSGEKQTAMILQAAIQNSAITIFDEPIANIDAVRTQTLFSLLSSDDVFLQKIVITHDLHFAFSLGFDVLFLKGGRREFFGSCEEFFDEDELKKRFGGSVQKCELGVVTNYAKL